ncbi:MAG: hypothetical protein ACR2N2_06655 [Acidimicrobiia bacterium]
MADSSVSQADDAPDLGPHEHALREAMTIGLYLSIVLLALLVGVGANETIQHQIQLIWGTSVGLGIAHLFAYRMTAVFAAGGKLTSEDWYSVGGMVAATVIIAGIATIPYLLLDDALDASTAAMVLLLGVIAITAWATAKRSGLSPAKTAGYTALVVFLAAVVVAVKYTLTH